MRALTRRDRKALALLSWLVARRAICVRRVLGVVEFSTERRQGRKWLHRTGIGVRVADGAHLAALWILEVGHMAPRAWGVVRLAREAHLRR